MKQNLSGEMKRFNYLLGEIGAVYHELSLRLGVTDSVMRIIYTVCNAGGSCSLQDVCKLSGLSKQTVNSALRGLERDGCVCLEKENGRSKRVCLTERGQELAERAAVPVIKAENEIFASWKPKETEKYLELTERYLLQLREKAAQMPADKCGSNLSAEKY